jgi:hypothetical protein
MRPRTKVRGISSWKNDVITMNTDVELIWEAPEELQSVNKIRGLPLGAEKGRVAARQGV